MGARRGRLIALMTVGLGLAVLIGAGFLSKDRIQETWYLHKLKTGDHEDRQRVFEWLSRHVVGLEELKQAKAKLKMIDALVSAVDPKEPLVVLSVGKNLNVKPGYQFTVSRGEEFVGKVEVIKVYPSLSGARILYTKDGQQIERGDKAFRLNGDGDEK